MKVGELLAEQGKFILEVDGEKYKIADFHSEIDGGHPVRVIKFIDRAVLEYPFVKIANTILSSAFTKPLDPKFTVTRFDMMDSSIQNVYTEDGPGGWYLSEFEERRPRSLK